MLVRQALKLKLATSSAFRSFLHSRGLLAYFIEAFRGIALLDDHLN